MWWYANSTTLININRRGQLRGEEMYVGKGGALKLVFLSEEAAGVDR